MTGAVKGFRLSAERICVLRPFVNGRYRFATGGELELLGHHRWADRHG
jgi:hypothetical protein